MFKQFCKKYNYNQDLKLKKKSGLHRYNIRREKAPYFMKKYADLPIQNERPVGPRRRHYWSKTNTPLVQDEAKTGIFRSLSLHTSRYFS